MSQYGYMVWGGVLATVCLAMLGLFLLILREQRRQAPPRRRGDCAGLLAEAKELEELAAAAYTKALEATTTAAHALAQLDLAQAETDAASHALDATTAALDEASTSVRPPASGRDDPKELSSAAMAAYRQGAISADQLRLLWQKIDGWEPGQDELAHELTRLRAEDVDARRRYDNATFLERAARQAADVAEVASRALTQEAADAAAEAQEARVAFDQCRQRPTR
ncbi:hypothetical protein [Hamadaea tsunoensis]|uniref:hypothetical protein n=1 Tax=Hamadaea tsunoensis TaxID=53368 RepID=UPI00040C34FF|nr:hypothetical protein [Hamadaea tsunoensis]